MTAAGDGAKAGRGRGAGARLSAARLAVVQALYQMEIAGASLERVLGEFLEHRRDGALGIEPDTAQARPKTELFTEVLRGTVARRAEIDEILSAALPADWPLGRIEVLLACILRAGIYELLARPEVPVRVAISEYVDLADAFFAARERNMVNAILDTVGRRLREGEIGRDGGGPDARAAGAG